MARKEPPSEAPALPEPAGISSRDSCALRDLAERLCAALPAGVLEAILRVRRAGCASASVEVLSEPPLFAYRGLSFLSFWSIYFSYPFSHA